MGELGTQLWQATRRSTRRMKFKKMVWLLKRFKSMPSPLIRVSPGFPGGSDGKESAYNAGDLDLIPGSGRSPGEGNGYPLQYSCLENSMDRGAMEP